MTDFAALLKVFSEAEAEFIIIGGFAGNLHGSAPLSQPNFQLSIKIVTCRNAPGSALCFGFHAHHTIRNM